MATPVGYTQQFIPTDIGMLERNLAATQQRADSAYQGLLQADSQFANVLATNQDAAIKDKLLGNFRSKSDEILKKYGYDYAKASKELAREVVNTGNDKFWQLNAAKQRGIDTYNQMKVKMGSDAIDGYNPANTPIYNEEFKQYTSPEEFNPTVYSSTTLNKGLEGTFGPRMNALDETLMQNRGPNGILTATTIKGVTEQKVPELAEEMYNQLKQDAPLANDAQLRAKANSTALSYVQGQIKHFMNDPEYATAARQKNNESSLFYGNMTTKITDRIGANMSPDIRKEVLDGNNQTSGTLEENYALKARKKFIDDNPEIKEVLSGDTEFNSATGKYESKYGEEDFMTGDINQMISDRKKELKRQISMSRNSARTDSNPASKEANKKLITDSQKKLDKLYSADNKLRADIDNYYNSTTGDYELPVFGYNESLEGADSSGLSASAYGTQMNAVKKNMQSTIDKYTIGEDLIIESGGYDEKFQKDVEEKQRKGKDLNNEEKVFASLKSKGGMEFMGLTGNSYTGVKVIVKNADGNQHIVKAATPVVLRNILNNFNMPELYEMDAYKEEVRRLIPGKTIGDTKFSYDEEAQNPYLVKSYGENGVKNYVTYRDYVDGLDKLGLSEEEEDSIVSQLLGTLSNKGLTMDSPYSPGKNNQYKLIKLVNLLEQ